jgi:hypothetical protein
MKKLLPGLILLILSLPAMAVTFSVPNLNVAGSSELSQPSSTPGQCQNISAFGGSTSSSDNSAAFAAALSASPANNQCVKFGPGNWDFGANVAYTFPSATGASITIEGAGSGVTNLIWPAGGGLTINYYGTSDSANVKNLTIETGAVNTGTALFLNQAASVSNESNSALNSIKNVTIQGSDQFSGGTEYWATQVNSSVSNVNFIDDHFMAPGGDGNEVVLAGTSTQVPVIFNFVSDYFQGGSAQLTYGDNVQGVQIADTNFIDGSYAIFAPSAATGLDELTVTGSQFNAINSNIYEQGSISNTSVVGNLFYVQNSNYGIDLAASNLFSIIGNEFAPAGTGASSIGINIGASTTAGGTITGNVFYTMGTAAVTLGSSSQNVTVNSNAYYGNGVNVNDAGAKNLAASSAANPGYEYSSAGILHEWGSTALTTSATGTFTITFPKAFPTAVFACTLVNGDSSVALGNPVAYTGASTTTSTLAGQMYNIAAATAITINWSCYGD